MDPMLNILTAALVLADNEISDEEDSSSSDDGIQKGRGQKKKKAGKRRIRKREPPRQTCFSDDAENFKSIRERCFSDEDPPEPEKIRGYVLVIVNYKFEGSPLRRGNEIEQIRELFPDYRYKVRSFTNQNNKQILRHVRRYSEKENSGSLICFISSHGDQTSIACPDGRDVRISDILKTANTNQLRNRPKVFFIDACRVSIGGRVREEHIPEPPSTEYFIGFSCLGSKTSTQIGSNSCGIYIKTLLGVFKDGFWRPSTEYGKSRDINHFMQKVHFLVTEQRDKKGKKLQEPTIRSSLTRKLFLQGH